MTVSFMLRINYLLMLGGYPRQNQFGHIKLMTLAHFSGRSNPYTLAIHRVYHLKHARGP